MLGMGYDDKSNDDKAIEAFDKSLESKRDNHKAKFQRGQAYFRRATSTNAKRDLEDFSKSGGASLEFAKQQAQKMLMDIAAKSAGSDKPPEPKQSPEEHDQEQEEGQEVARASTASTRARREVGPVVVSADRSVDEQADRVASFALAVELRLALVATSARLIASLAIVGTRCERSAISRSCDSPSTISSTVATTGVATRLRTSPDWRRLSDATRASWRATAGWGQSSKT